ncbi:helix-turn-helix domain-containing protein [Jannaschia marina]|uniref:helix-turn-helix domain-containing protein n=1 Tax=Jannaschia marina TaxID=2741674 RepID=UPI0015CBBF31|nr:AraC family transcriptional regulator [Jannaschia marina]
MIDIEVFQFGLSTLLLGMSSFCASSLLLRHRRGHPTLPLALFFLALSIILLPIFLRALDSGARLGWVHLAIEFLEIPLGMTLAPLFWLYVRGLTSEDDAPPVRFKALHLAPILLGIAIYGVFLSLPGDIVIRLERGEVLEGATAPFFVACLYVLTSVFHGQLALYLILVFGMLRRYNARLKDLFASTETRELNWLWWIAGTGWAYWAFSVTSLLAASLGGESFDLSTGASIALTAVFTIPVLWILALWSLRQQPGLSQPVGVPASVAPAGKYERSALDEGRARRLAARIEAAMREDRLHRNPNLSLWDLARHVGGTANHVSQTLNETVGESFFDYVNRKRVRDAMARIARGDETVLAITYDVGFNSRSAFYRAFRRETGLTPGAWRKSRDAARDPA